MSLGRTHRSKSQRVTPAEAGVHIQEEVDSRFRGNDVTFDGVRQSYWRTKNPRSRSLVS